MKKIAYLAPDMERLERIRSLLAAHQDEIIFSVGSLDVGVKVAKALLEKGVEIIIARGETAGVISDALPEALVVPVPITGFDLAVALEESRRYGPTVAVISFPSMVRRVEQLEAPLGVRILKYELPPLPSREAIDRLLDKALAAGASVILGGYTPSVAARERAIPYVAIPTSDETYQEAFSHARSLLKSIEQERQRSGFIEGVLDYAYEGIISIDSRGFVSLMNPVARKILKCSSTKGRKPHITTLWPELDLQAVVQSGKEERDNLYRVQGTQVLCNKAPILSRGRVLGAVATFQETDRIQTMESRIRKETYARGHVARYTFGMIRAVDKSTRELLDRARNIADADANVIILGETGTGKEVFAQSIHQASKRHGGPFVAVNCAALPASLLESELFGYDEGAFTGAKKAGKPGLFELAHKGTLFLDEIAEMDCALQSRLLRVLQERAIMRLGSDRIVPVDVRVIAATHNNLSARVKDASFRQDLYYRLNILTLHLPPLRERRKDIPSYASSFIAECAAAVGRKVALSPGALRYLEQCPWPGNIRELQNMMERVVALSKRETINVAHLRALLDDAPAPRQADVRAPRRAREEAALREALCACTGELEATAQALGISRVTLWRRMARYGLDKKDWR